MNKLGNVIQDLGHGTCFYENDNELPVFKKKNNITSSVYDCTVEDVE